MIAQAPSLTQGDPPAGAVPNSAAEMLTRPVVVEAQPRFFWSLVPSPGSVRPGPIPLGVASEVQADIPVDLAELHAVCAPSRAGEPCLLVCTARRTDLEPLLDHAESLAPPSLPAFAHGLGVDPADLNLLVGEFLPRPLRRRRARRHLAAAALALACVGMVWLGLHRRERAALDRAADANTQHGALLATLGRAGTSPADLRRRVNELTQLRHALSGGPASPDAAAVLSGVLAAWPAAIAPSPESLSVQASSVTATVTVDGDVRPVLDALTTAPWPAGWTLQPPQLTKSNDRTRVSVDLRPTAPPIPSSQ